MARDYLDVGRYVRRAVAAEDLSLHSSAPFEHCLCHGVELGLKSLLMLTDDSFEPQDYGHDLKKLRGKALDQPEVQGADTEMAVRLGEIERDDLIADGAAWHMRGEPVDRTTGDGHGIIPEDLFAWYRQRHMSSGGWFRYPKTRLESGPAVSKLGRNGAFRPIPLRPLALEFWLDAFLARVEGNHLRASPVEAT